MQVLIGIDDTDNLESMGTGRQARTLGAALEAKGLAVIQGISRHQLLVDARIPYTSHNSSACLLVELNAPSSDDLAHYCRRYLVQESAAGADAGLCIVPALGVPLAVQEFGQAAKEEILTQEAALTLAQQHRILLEGLTGTRGGVIGALAAVGLRAGGNDGRMLWLRGLRELDGIYTAEQLAQAADIDAVHTVTGHRVPAQARIDVGNWARPILRAGRTILLVEEADDHEPYDWRVADRELIKQISE